MFSVIAIAEHEGLLLDEMLSVEPDTSLNDNVCPQAYQHKNPTRDQEESPQRGGNFGVAEARYAMEVVLWRIRRA
jgi:hypothetical protein